MEELTKQNAILIDIDGTICNSSIAMDYLNGVKEDKNYEVYYRLLDMVTPIPRVIWDIKEKCISRAGDNEESPEIIPTTLVFLTGRNAEKHVMQYTLEFIEKNFSDTLSYPEVQADFYFRPINDHTQTTKYKIQKFQMLKTMYNFTHIYEDEASNILMFYKYKQEQTLVHWVKSSYNYSLDDTREQVSVPDDVIMHLV